MASMTGCRVSPTSQDRVMRIYMYIDMYIYIYRERERERESPKSPDQEVLCQGPRRGDWESRSIIYSTYELYSIFVQILYYRIITNIE